MCDALISKAYSYGVISDSLNDLFDGMSIPKFDRFGYLVHDSVFEAESTNVSGTQPTLLEAGNSATASGQAIGIQGIEGRCPSKLLLDILMNNAHSSLFTFCRRAGE
jgi:hypothetical protein